MEAPVLTIADPLGPFEVTTDASNIAIGAILIQHQHPVAFLSRKLNTAEKNYTTQDKELLAIIESLRNWRHFLLGKQFTLWTDHKPLQYILTQPVLTERHARWMILLAPYDIQIKHIAGKKNEVADALSRSAQDGNLASISTVTTSLIEQIKKAYFQDSDILDIAKALIDNKRNIVQKAYRNASVQNGYIYLNGQQLWVPKGDIRLRVMQETHDTPFSGYMGFDKTYQTISTDFYWPNITANIHRFVSTC